MVVDSSALVAILRQEAESAWFSELILLAERVRVAAPTLLETAMVLEGPTLSITAGQRLDQLIDQLHFEVVAFDESLLKLARDAFRRYGKGRHAAGLNFGDCMSYAAAKQFNEPLLFKGGDFALTDIRSAAPRQV